MPLTLNGSDPTGDLGDLLDAKLNLAGGKILQIVRATDATSRSTTSTSFVDVTGMSVTITPQKSTSAVLVISTANWGVSWGSGSTGFGNFQITDSSNNTISGAERLIVGANGVGFTGELFGLFTLFGYATPATTSAVTYKLRFYSQSAAITVSSRNELVLGQMYAIEVSA